MMKILTKLNLNRSFKNWISNAVYAYFIFQFLSLLGRSWPGLQEIVFLLIVLAAIIFSWRKIEYGFLFLLFEFLAGHEGHCFSFRGISLRLSLFLVIMFVWFLRKMTLPKSFLGKLKSLISLEKSPLSFSLLAFLFVIIFSLLRGWFINGKFLAIKDFLNYSYFFLIFPLSEIIGKRFFQKRSQQILQAGIIGISLLTIIVLVLFATGIVNVHDQFYWWWRQTVFGKATSAGNNFFRIVSSAHLLILPFFLILLSLAAHRFTRKKSVVFLAVLASLTLLINFSRAYFLGLFFGLIFLAQGLKSKKWMAFFLIVVIFLVAEFGILNFLINQSPNMLYLRQRIKSIASPEDELSASVRLNILPCLLEKIKKRPIFGYGLGSTISYLNPISQKQDITFHIDWGYLEIWLELGLLGLILYCFILAIIFYQGRQLFKKARGNVKQQRLIVGLGAGLLSLVVATITGPYLFHALGIFYLISVIVVFNYKNLASSR
ncbi:hypothetical protein B6D52_01265 [Candidatus Parcubacteria bacterium 4484_255]|nr:MAG: hypothetical protein B6D52_01265 [Candidatus Parcubacteria bacterium 4484_255]